MMIPPSLISKILFSSPDFIIEKDKSGLSGLIKDQIVDAKVLKVLQGGRAVLSIRGESVTAKTDILLKPNESVRLQVLEAGDTKRLRLVPPDKMIPLPEGFQGVRAFGRSGLFKELVAVLKQYRAETPAAQPQTEIHFSAAQKDLQSGINRSARMQAGGELLSREIEGLKSFIGNKDISLSLKSAILLTKINPETEGLPAGVTDRFVKHLFSALSNGAEPAPGKPVSEQLFSKVVQLREQLPEKALTLVDTVVNKNSLPQTYKLLAVLASASKTEMSEPVAMFQKFMQKSLDVNLPAPLADVLTGSPEGGHILKGRVDIHPEFRQLDKLLDLLTVKPDNLPDAAELKTIVRDTGLMWESKLRQFIESTPVGKSGSPVEVLPDTDIKALAMRLAAGLEGADDQASNRLKTFIDGLEKLQLLNRQAFDDSGKVLLPLPFLSGQELRFGQLLIDLDREGRASGAEQPKTVRVAFILEMSRLGHLRADFAVYKKTLSGLFGVENQEVREHLVGLIPELIKTLNDQGYNVRKIDCEVFPDGELSVTSLTDMMVDTTEGLLNIIV